MPRASERLRSLVARVFSSFAVRTLTTIARNSVDVLARHFHLMEIGGCMAQVCALCSGDQSDAFSGVTTQALTIQDTQEATHVTPI